MSDRPGDSTVYIHTEHATRLTDQETHNMSDRPGDTRLTKQETHNISDKPGDTQHV